NPILVDGINYHLVSQLIVSNQELHRFIDRPVSFFQVVVISQNHNAVFLPFGVRFGYGDLNVADALKGGLRIPSDVQVEIIVFALVANSVASLLSTDSWCCLIL